MKIIWALFLATCIYSKLNKKKHSYRQPRKISDALMLASTPKASNLLDHFGADSQRSHYGPRPRLVKQEVTVKNAAGVPEQRNITHIVHYPQGYDDKPCEIHAMQDYELCLNISDCDICTVNPHCGWCEASGQCLPGNKGYSSCAHSCVNGWVFGERSCTNKVRAGRFSNIAPEAEGFITPEMTQKKYFVRSEIHHPAVVSTPVILGVKKQVDDIVKRNSFTNEIVSHHKTEKIIPIVGQIHQKLDVATIHQQFVDAKSGLRLDAPEEKSMHGTQPY